MQVEFHDKNTRDHSKFLQFVPPPYTTSNWLLVMPRMTVWNEQQYVFPIGLPHISSALKISGRRVFTINLTYKEEDVSVLLEDAIRRNNINIVATGGITSQYSQIKEITDTAKTIKPDITVIVGGGIITSDPCIAMTAFENVDYGVIGEGEITVCNLAYALETGKDLANVKGIVYKTEGNWKVTQLPDDISDLDMIPWPDYDGFDYSEMLDKVPIDMLSVQIDGEKLSTLYFSRSCPYNCTFCFHSCGKKYRTRTLDSFFEEFDYLINKYAFNCTYISDELFLHSLDFVKNFCEKIKPYGIRWSCMGRVDNITREMLEVLIDAGCYLVYFGVESANDNVLKSMQKNITRAQIENAFSLCEKVGLEAQGGLIFGDLEETVETAMETISWWKIHPTWNISLGWIIAYPGSYDYKVACKRGLISDPVQYIKDGCPEVNFSKMTDEERRHIASVIASLQNEQHDIIRDAVISSGKFGKINMRGGCPYCGEVGTFLNLDPIRQKKLEICPSCNHTLRIRPYDYVDKGIFNNNILNVLKTSKIAFWPIVTGLMELIQNTPALHSDKVFFIDSSTYKQGMDYCGKVVQAPKVIAKENIDTVFLTTATNVSVEIENTINKNYPGVKCIKLVGDLYFAKE